MYLLSIPGRVLFCLVLTVFFVSCVTKKSRYLPKDTPLALEQENLPFLEPGFVYVDTVAPLVKVDLMYAGNENFVGRPLAGYRGKRAILRIEAAEALRLVSEDLATRGYTLLIKDAYRPHTAMLDIAAWGKDISDQKMKALYYPHIDKKKIFEDKYIRDISEHSRGVAVDVTLLDSSTGLELDMGGRVDLLDPSSATDSKLVSDLVFRNRQLLKNTFRKHGFANYAPEWWHYRLINEPEKTLYFYFPLWDGMLPREKN